MSNRPSGAGAWCAFALITLLATPALAQVEIDEAPPPSYGTAFAVLDPDHAVRDAVAPDIAQRVVHRVQGDTARGELWTETMFSALAAVSSEVGRLDREGRLDGPSRRDVATLATIAVADFLVDAHPELLPVLTGFSEDLEPLDSPIERLCECDKSGSRACGCQVGSTGSGSCNYKVLCPSVLRAACSAVNLHLCIAETLSGLFVPERDDPRPADGQRRPVRTR